MPCWTFGNAMKEVSTTQKALVCGGISIANSKGEFFLETVIPGSYPGRTPHLHVKVQRKGGQVLTTQLYLPNHPGNAQDFLFDPRLSLVSQGQDFHWQFVLPS